MSDIHPVPSERKEVYRRNDHALVGRLCKTDTGWMFFPFAESRKPSKKSHRCEQDAVPRWVGAYYTISDSEG